MVYKVEPCFAFRKFLLGKIHFPYPVANIYREVTHQRFYFGYPAYYGVSIGIYPLKPRKAPGCPAYVIGDVSLRCPRKGSQRSGEGLRQLFRVFHEGVFILRLLILALRQLCVLYLRYLEA